MTHKLACAIVCIGIAVGSLSAPKTSNSGTQPGQAASATPEQSVAQSDGRVNSLSSVNAPLGAVASSLAFDAGALQTGHPGTNSFGVTLQQ